METFGGGCILVLKGNVEMRHGRIDGCRASNQRIEETFDGSFYDHFDGSFWRLEPPRGGAVDVISGSLTFDDVQFANIHLDESHRSTYHTTFGYGGSAWADVRPDQGAVGMGGVFNLRPGSSLSLLNSQVECRGHAQVGLYDNKALLDWTQLDAKSGGAIAADGATVSISGSTITGCRAWEGGAIYLMQSATANAQGLSTTLTMSGSMLVDNAATCVYDPTTCCNALPQPTMTCSSIGGAAGGCILAHQATVDISSSSLVG